ncbi:MAG: hypothetical protein IH991_11290 [Planctomycetes bacterium]|nr:hypothetical protein [Planctomycetota bacterium]
MRVGRESRSAKYLHDIGQWRGVGLEHACSEVKGVNDLRDDTSDAEVF